jgi:hypothetical protein
MSAVVEVKTGSTVSEVVEQLAASAGASSICLPVPRKIDAGEWVRFTVVLEDGTPILEGIGRSEGSLPRGNPVDRYDLELSELSFDDERNEIMFERVLIAREARAKGDDTGSIKLDDATVERIEERAAKGAPGDEKAAPRRSVPPPLPAAAKQSTPPARASTPPSKKSVPPPKKSVPPPKKSVPPPAKASTSPAKKSTPPPAKGSTPPAKASTPPARASTPPGKLPPKKKSTPPPPSTFAREDDTTIETKSPSPSAAPRSPSPRSTPPRSSVKREAPYSLEVDAALVARARSLELTLPPDVLARDPRPGKPEAAILSAALRIGLAALQSLTEEE